MKSERDAMCGHPDCRKAAKVGIDTRPRFHGIDASRYPVRSTMIAHAFVFGGGNAA